MLPSHFSWNDYLVPPSYPHLLLRLLMPTGDISKLMIELNYLAISYILGMVVFLISKFILTALWVVVRSSHSCPWESSCHLVGHPSPPFFCRILIVTEPRFVSMVKGRNTGAMIPIPTSDNRSWGKCAIFDLLKDPFVKGSAGYIFWDWNCKRKQWMVHVKTQECLVL